MHNNIKFAYTRRSIHVLMIMISPPQGNPAQQRSTAAKKIPNPIAISTSLAHNFPLSERRIDCCVLYDLLRYDLHKKNCRAHAVVLSTQKSKKTEETFSFTTTIGSLTAVNRVFFLQQHENSLTHEKLRSAGGVGSALSSAAQRRKKRKT